MNRCLSTKIYKIENESNKRVKDGTGQVNKEWIDKIKKKTNVCKGEKY